MCGIVGAASPRNVVPILIDGIRRLEYRGYDSTGLAVINGAAGAPRLERLVSTARVADLAAQAEARRSSPPSPASRTRAGRRTARRTPANAHPHTSQRRDRRRPQRHHRELRGAARAAEGAGLRVRHADRHRGDRAPRARALAWRRRRRPAARGAAGGRRIPRRLRDRGDLDARAGPHRRRARRAARWSSGIGADDHFLASDAAALLSVTRRVAYLEEGDVADVRRESLRDLRRAAASASSAPVVTIEASGAAVELGPYRHFMQKEIFEQPRAVADTLEGGRRHRRRRCSARTPRAMLRARRQRADPRLRHELLLGARREAVDRNARAHSLHGRDRQRVPLSRQRAQPDALVVVVSQSGETADTLAALKHAKALGHAHTLAICNVATSARWCGRRRSPI